MQGLFFSHLYAAVDGRWYLIFTMSEGNGNAGVSAKRSDGDRACCADMTPATHRAHNLLLTHTRLLLLITHGWTTDLSRWGLISMTSLWLICVFMITISFGNADSIRTKLYAVIINEYILANSSDVLELLRLVPLNTFERYNRGL